jgi:parallel beta-helix repeat protein
MTVSRISWIAALGVIVMGAMAPAAGAAACNRYVATTGTDTSNDGRDSGRPLRTIQKAADLTVAGDVVCLRAGTYREYPRLRNSGTSSQPIVYQSYPGEHAIIDGSDRVPDPNWTAGQYPEMVLISGSRITFRDIELKSSAGVGLRIYGSSAPQYCIVEDIVSHGHYSDGIDVWGSFHTIQRNTCYDNYDFGVGGGNNADGIHFYLGGNHTVRDNLSYHNSDDGIDLYRSMNNTVYRNVAHTNGYGTLGNGAGFKAGGVGHPEGGFNLLYNNLAFQNKKEGFDSYGSGGTKFYHNVSYRNGKNGFLIPCQYGSTPNIIRNNIAFDNNQQYGGNDVNLYPGGCTGSANQSVAPICSHNMIGKKPDGTLDTSTTCTSSVSPTSPGFVDGANRNFHLTATSAAINVGINLATLPDGVNVAVDYDGIARPQGAGYDIGAFEYVSGGNNPPPSVTNLRRNDRH